MPTAHRLLSIVSYGENIAPLLPSPTFSYNLRDFPTPHEIQIRHRAAHDTTGVQQWLLSNEAFRRRIDDARKEITYFAKSFDKVGSPQECEVTVGVGCQLGRHRSVTFANELARQLEEGLKGQLDWQITVVHRDLDKKAPRRSRS